MNYAKFEKPGTKDTPLAVKLVIVGDGAVGKTCLLVSYTTNRFPQEHVPTVFDNISTNVQCKDKLVQVNLWDTAGQEEYDRLRPLSYPQTDVFLLVYDMTNPDSFANLEQRWFPELRHHCPNAPVIIIGNKVDLRNDPFVKADLAKRHQTVVSIGRAQSLKNQMNALKVFECSAKTQQGLREAFTFAVELAVDRKLGAYGDKRGGGGAKLRECVDVGCCSIQ